MSGPALLAPKARAEFLDALRRIGRENPAAAQRLRDAVDTAARRLGAWPQLGRTELSLARPQFRFWSLPAFSMLLVYDTQADPILILRMLHTAQDLPKLLKDLGS